MDEIWTFQFARRILYGQVPYRDFFMIVSPLKAQIDSLFLKIFSDQLITLRWVGLFSSLVYGFLLYRLSIKFGLNKRNSLIPVVLFFFSYTFFPFNNYNWFSLILIALILFPLSSTQNWKNALIVGLLSAFLVLTKQNVGIYMLIGIIFYYWITRYKFTFISFIGFCIGLLPEILYFQTKSSLPDFLKIFYENWIAFFNEFVLHKSLIFTLFILFVFIFFMLFVLFKEKIKKVLEIENLFLLIMINFIVLGFSFPIFDLVHLFFLLPYLFLLIFIKWKCETNVIFYLLAFLIVFKGFSCYFSIQNSSISSFQRFKMIPIDQNLERSISLINDFQIKQMAAGNHPYVIDYQNVLYDVAMDRLGHKYDCMLKGNFGKNGENEVISNISKDPKAVVIFQKDYTNQKQQTKITEYVKINLVLQETIEKKYLVFSHKR